MGNRKKKKRAYDASLSGIVIWAALDMFVFLLIGWVILGLIMYFNHRLDAEGWKLMQFCLALVVLFSYWMPICSLFKVWHQERILGIYWKDRTDHNRPEWDRDWYLSYDRGGFHLYHRNYVRRIVAFRTDEEVGSYGRGKVYLALFEDIKGRKHTLKFSSADGQAKFQKWYEKQPIEENRKKELPHVP